MGRAAHALSLPLLWVACTASTAERDAHVVPPRSEDRDLVTITAKALVHDACVRPPDPAPAWRASSVTDSAFDVVVYTAHPDDEAMYAGGTMDRLVRAGHRVAFVAMSHGEGGRLLERGPDGNVVERRDYPRTHVVEVRDREIAEAARRIGVSFAQLYPGSADVDFDWTTSCEASLAHWQRALPDGTAGMLRRLITDIRARRPRVVITLDPRDDPQASHHGHHKAVGVLVEAAARLAADPRVHDGGAPHVVEELLTSAPRDLPSDETIAVPVDVRARLHMLDAYASQFVPDQLAVDPIAQRPSEQFVLRWRAVGAPAATERARLLELVAPTP
jgi:LmbE family N-acetylglucosaminyl deacetylase